MLSNNKNLFIYKFEKLYDMDNNQAEEDDILHVIKITGTYGITWDYDRYLVGNFFQQQMQVRIRYYFLTNDDMIVAKFAIL